LKIKTNIGTILSHFNTWHNCEVTRELWSDTCQK